MTPVSPPTADRDALRVAVIGYEFMGRAHAHAWSRVRAAFGTTPVELAVLVGRSPDKVAEAADRLGFAEHATDWREVIDRDDIDIVDVCTPGFLHAEIGIAALEAGKHVLMEKPLSNTLEESRRMVHAAEKARVGGVHALMGFTYRRLPALAHARALIRDGALGGIRQVRVAYLQDFLADETAPMTWRLRRETAGSGALGDIGSHAIDQVRYLLDDDVVDVAGDLATFVPERPAEDGSEATEAVTVDDAAWAWMTMRGGAKVSIEASRMALGRRNALRIEVYGSDGALAFDLERLNELELYRADDPPTEQGFRRILVTEPGHSYLEGWWPPGHTLGWDHAFVHQIRDLLEAIRTGTPAAPDFAAGLAVQEVLAAIETSAASDSRRIRLTDR